MTIRFHELAYSLKIWATSVLLAPLICFLIEAIVHSSVFFSVNEALSCYPYIVIFGGMCSFFTWIIFFLLIRLSVTVIKSIRLIKYVIAATGVVLTFLTILIPVWLLSDSPFELNIAMIELLAGNCICIVGGSLIYELYTIILCEP
ncbi:hypothetical protein CKK33_06190 [Mucilaginibacter sp. MD40]|nr:hypothetical protein CKK33_06190 [Mucilaginibacter sp. MD40]